MICFWRAVPEPMEWDIQPLCQGLGFIGSGHGFSSQPLLGSLGSDGFVGMPKVELQGQFSGCRNFLLAPSQGKFEPLGKGNFFIGIRHGVIVK